MTGKTIAHYVILGKLGSGGMGDVYKAEDMRLGRKVAVKLLSKDYSEDRAAVERFELEARAASTINHPGICTVLDTGYADGAPYLVMELLEGQTIRERIAEGPMPLADLLEYGSQIADALDAAHSHGILHRDIKPANLFLTKRRLAKILDFGLAKLTPARRGVVAGEIDSRLVTQPGLMMGTVAYMSPEQAMGTGVDARTDLFSFGVVLYEMATGKLPFTGETSVATFDAILHATPAAARRLNGELPPEFDNILSRCLEKDRDLRYQTAADLRAGLRRLLRQVETGVREPLPEAVRANAGNGLSRPAKSAIAGVGLAVLAVGVWRVTNRPPGGPDPSKVRFTQLTRHSGEEFFPSLSPDGKTLIYQGKIGDNWDILMRRVGGAKVVNLTQSCAEDDTHPTYSPDGERIAYRSNCDGGGIFVMGATGESRRRVASEGHNPAWSPDGRLIAYASKRSVRGESRQAGSSLWIVDAATGAARRVGSGDGAQPSFSPNGKRLAFWRITDQNRREIWTMPVEDGAGAAVRLTDDRFVNWNPIWSPDGKFVYYLSDRGGSMNLWRVNVDENTGKPGGRHEPVSTPSGYTAQISFARDGKKLVYVNDQPSIQICHRAFDPVAEKFTGPIVWLTRGTRRSRHPALSPDGAFVAFAGESSREEDVYIMGAEGSEPHAITGGGTADRSPRWSPDGKSIAYISAPAGGGKAELWTMSADGNRKRQISTAGQGELTLPVWTADGGIVCSETNGPTWIFQESKPALKIAPPADGNIFAASAWREDGRIAGHLVNPQGETLGVTIYESGTGAYTRVTKFGSEPQWLPGGKRLMFVFQSAIYVAEASGKAVRKLVDMEPYIMSARFSLAPGGKRIDASLTAVEADIWMANFE